MLAFIKEYALPLSVLALALSIVSSVNAFMAFNRYDLIPTTGVLYLIDKQNGTYTITAISSPDVSYSFQKELDKPVEESVVLKNANYNLLKKAGVDMPEMNMEGVTVPPKRK